MYDSKVIIVDYGCKLTQYLLGMERSTHSQVSVWMHSEEW